MIVLDTNVISEAFRSRPDPQVIAWINAQVIETLFFSIITVAELRFGVASMPAGKRRDQLLERYETELFPLFDGRILTFDDAAASTYGEVMAQARSKGLAVSAADGYIAASVAANKMLIATRDTAPFEAVGLDVVNPWTMSND